MNKNSLFQFQLAILSIVFSFFMSFTAQSERLGRCVIIDVYVNDNTNNKRFDQYCLDGAQSLNDNAEAFLNQVSGNSFQKQFIAGAFQVAEYRLSGQSYGIVGNRNVRIYVDPSELVSAGIYADADTVYIFLNAGMLMLIDGTISSLGLEISQSQTMNSTPTGITFSDWMELFRLASYMDKPFVPQGGLDTQDPDWQIEKLIPISLLLEFVFSHELAHLQYGEYCGVASAPPNTMQGRRKVEEACDQIAIKGFFEKSEDIAQLIIYLPALQLAHANAMALFSEDIVDSYRFQMSNDLKKRHIDELSKTMPKRLDSNMDFILENINYSFERKKQVKAFYEIIKREPLATFPSKAQHVSLDDIYVRRTNVDWMDRSCKQFKQTYRLINENENRSIRLTFEFQSRQVPRSEDFVSSDRAQKDSQGRYYKLASSNRQTITLAPKEQKDITQGLECFPTDIFMPSIGYRIVEGEWLN